jgi:hypothetical protein
VRRVEGSCCGRGVRARGGSGGVWGRALSPSPTGLTETLEVVPRRKVVQYVREKFTCRECEKITQEPAPFHVLSRGFAGPSLLAMILFEKYGQHQTLNRQFGALCARGRRAEHVDAGRPGRWLRRAAAAPARPDPRSCIRRGSGCTATRRRCRFWPGGRRRPDGLGSMCATTLRSAAAIRRRRCYSIPATAPARTRSVI